MVFNLNTTQIHVTHTLGNTALKDKEDLDMFMFKRGKRACQMRRVIRAKASGVGDSLLSRTG